MNSMRVPGKKISIARDKEVLDRCREYRLNSID
jgi:hypothetical protein